MKPPPAFQFYPDDWLAGTVDMSDDEKGLYMTLLCIQWSRGGIPDDDFEIASFSRRSTKPLVQPSLGSTGIQPELHRTIQTVRRKFKRCDDGVLRNERLEVERAKQKAFRDAQSLRGQASAKARFNQALGSTKPLDEPKPVEIRCQPEGNSPSPSPSPSVQEDNTLSSSPRTATDKGYHQHTRIALWWLNDKAGRHHRENDVNLKLASQRLKEAGVDIEGVKKMIDRQVSLWRGTDMEQYLRPETIFGKTKFTAYYDDRDLPVSGTSPESSSDGFGEFQP